MLSFEFYNPVRVISGAGKVAQIGEEALPFGKKALLVSYREYGFMTELLECVAQSLTSAGIEGVPFYEIVANPMMSDVDAGIVLAREQGVDLVIAVGGGSVMDSAKSIAAGVLYEGDTCEMFTRRHDESATASGPVEALPLLMVPTLPATSSEMNCGAVITHDETEEKVYMFAPCLYSRVSILDPEVLTTLPAYQTACGTVDALSHILEIYLNTQVNNPVQLRIMEGIGKTLVDIGPQVLNDPQNVELRGIQQWACCVAWNGWIMPGMDGFFPMHAIGHSLSALYNIAHGHTLAVMMPAFMRFILDTAPARIVEFGETMMGFILKDGPLLDRAREVVDAFEAYLNGLGLCTKLAELEIPHQQLPAIQQNATRVYSDSNGMIAAVKPVSKAAVLDILELAY